MLVSSVYNKVLLAHFNPVKGVINIYELDPGYIYKNQHAINVPFDTMIQMQVIDNLFVVHLLDKRTTSVYDMKLMDYHIALGEDCEVKVEKAKKG